MDIGEVCCERCEYTSSSVHTLELGNMDGLRKKHIIFMEEVDQSVKRGGIHRGQCIYIHTDVCIYMLISCILFKLVSRDMTSDINTYHKHESGT